MSQELDDQHLYAAGACVSTSNLRHEIVPKETVHITINYHSVCIVANIKYINIFQLVVAKKAEIEKSKWGIGERRSNRNHCLASVLHNPFVSGSNGFACLSYFLLSFVKKMHKQIRGVLLLAALVRHPHRQVHGMLLSLFFICIHNKYKDCICFSNRSEETQSKNGGNKAIRSKSRGNK